MSLPNNYVMTVFLYVNFIRSFLTTQSLFEFIKNYSFLNVIGITHIHVTQLFVLVLLQFCVLR